jgi:hypothetical protein
MNWLGRRQATIHRVDETTRRAETRLEWIESVVADQRRAEERPTVNLIYDRLTRDRAGTGKAGEAHG